MSRSTSIKLKDGTQDRLKALSETKNRTSNWLMREAIEQYLAREEAELEFAREARESWEHYRATGLHVTQEELTEWFERTSRGDRVPMPKPHK